ncbi:putative Major facilitator superfamily (MFS) profile domain-containing protein [Seiridium cardinale]|uniref:Major facilitator superfamily (MFS) profile domain-containing protein n=1 Tax=Seiridium cardinale TaxID=138064 RepID=A0ABR2X9W3_9PEZI
MGGGTSIWASLEWGSDPREIFNGKLFYLAVVALAGCSYSFDQGNIGGLSSTHFAPENFEMIGARSGSLILLTTRVYGLVELAMTILYVAFILDRVGGRRPVIVGPRRGIESANETNIILRFAVPDSTAGTPAGGLVGIIWIYIYAFGWSFGWSVAPYVVAAEMSPARIRHSLDDDQHGLGHVPALCGTDTYIGAVFVNFYMSESKGSSIGSMDDPFQRSIRPMWKHTYPTEDEKVRHDVQEKIVQQVKDEGRSLEKKDTGPTVIHDEEST